MSEGASNPAKKPKKPVRLSLSSRLNLWFYRALFGALWALRPPRPRPIRLSGQSRVLAFSSAGLGDALLDSVAFRALAETYPGIHLAAVVHHRRPQIAQHNPLLKKLYFLRKGRWASSRSGGNSAPAASDAVLYLSCHDPEARCLGFLLNRDATVSLAWRTELNHLCAFNIDEPGLRRAHLAAQSLRVARETGAQTQYPRMVCEVAPEDRRALDTRLAELGISENPRIIFQLGGGGAGLSRLARRAFCRLGLRLAGRPASARCSSSAAPTIRRRPPDLPPPRRNAASAFTTSSPGLALPLSAALLERTQCLVSTDTGIMHLGFALKIPTVALLHCQPGAARVGPLADLDLHRVIELPRPPGYKTPADAPMSLIQPEQVLPEVMTVLTRS